MRIFLALMALLAAGSLRAQTPPPAEPPARLLTPAQLQEDFERLRFTLDRANPHTYRYASRVDMDALFSRVRTRLDRPMTDLAFFREIAPLVGAVRDSHTRVQLPASLQRYFASNGRTVFPLDIRYVLGQPLVEADLRENPSVPAGAILMSIDGRPMAEITSTLSAQIPVDGFAARSQLQRLGRSFWYLYGTAYGPASQYHVVTRDPRNGRVATHLLEGIPPQRLAGREARGRSAQPQRLEIGRDGIAVLTLDELSSEGTGVFLRESFARISESEITDLIIDLRNCPGGNDKFNNQLLSYLVDRPFRFYTGRDFVVRSYDDIRYIDYEISDFITDRQRSRLPPAQRDRPLETMALPELLRFMLSVDEAEGTFAPAREFRYGGRVYLLVGPDSASSAAEIAAIVHHLNLGTIIGDEPNGDYAGVSGGSIPELTLPHSQITVSMPLIAYHNAVMPRLFPGRGAPPAFPVTQSLEDALAGVDTVMNFTRGLIFARRLQDVPGGERTEAR